jgi:Domain of unknown function (DUF4148)
VSGFNPLIISDSEIQHGFCRCFSSALGILKFTHRQTATLAKPADNLNPTFLERNLTMNRAYASIAALAIATLSAGHALAADHQSPITREQVKAELAEAIRTGNIVANDVGQKLNELNPSAYPAQPVVAGKTREQVKAELAEAIRTHSLPVATGV